MRRLTDLERRDIKMRNSPKFKAEQARLKAENEAERLAARRRRNLIRNLLTERHVARENVGTAYRIDGLIARGEKGFGGVDIKPMGVDKWKAKYCAADRKLDSVTSEYDAFDD